MKKLLILLTMLFLAINLKAQIEPVDTDGNGFRNVSTLQNLRWISENDTSWSFNYELDNDINAAVTKNWNSSAGWKPIGTESLFFSGKFDGKGYKIDSLYINRPNENFIGFFGIVVGKNIEISRLGITNSSITGKNYVGSLVGRNSYCSLIDCYSTGIIKGAQYIGGLIGKTNYAQINNSYSNCTLTGSDYAGGLVGYTLESTVNKSYSTGTVSGAEFTGGIAGSIEKGYLIDSYSSGTLSGTNKVGGLVGYNNQSEISGSNSRSNVYGTDFVGGLVGNNDNCTIKNSYFTGKVAGKRMIGGLAGWNDGSIGNCYTKSSEIKGNELVGGLIGEQDGATIKFCNSECNVSGSESVGGLMGRNGFGVLFGCYSKDSVSGKSQNTGGCVGWNDGGSVLNCYSSSVVSGLSDVGGMVGDNDGGMIHNSYSISKVSGTRQNIGGFVGWNGSGKVINSYWDKEFSGMDKSTAGIGKTTSEMKALNTYSKFGWNFAAIWKIKSEINNGYPFLEKRTYPKTTPLEPKDTNGDSCKNIKCFANLVWISENPTAWGDKYQLDNDINADSSYYWDDCFGFSPIGTSSNHFTGKFAGNGHKIDSLYIYRTSQEYVGLFGFIDNWFTGIINLGVTNCSINGGNYTGAISGWSFNGRVSECYSEGSVSSFGVGGGLVGNNFGGKIYNSYSRAIVSGVSDIGGLVGWHDLDSARISYCYSTGVVIGNNYTGGFAGWNKSYIENCFWDKETSGKSTSDGGTGKTSTEMKVKSTFTDAHWDFNQIWNIDSQINDGYPYLNKGSSDVIEFDVTADYLNISPNPASDRVNLMLPENYVDYLVIIYNDYGQVVLGGSSKPQTSNPVNFSINIGSLPTGTYTLVLQSNSKRIMKRFAIVR
ncbi:MAG: GLUG motif-containing protein [bacterium]